MVQWAGVLVSRQGGLGQVCSVIIGLPSSPNVRQEAETSKSLDASSLSSLAHTAGRKARDSEGEEGQVFNT